MSVAYRGQGRQSGRGVRHVLGPMRVVSCLAIALACLLATSSSKAEPLRRPLYPQDTLLFDLILRSSDDLDLLTPRQIVLRDQFRRLGVAPGGETPSLATVFQARTASNADFDRFGPQRVRRERSYDFEGGVAVELTIPEATLFTALADTNAAGVAFRIPRDFTEPEVRVDVSSIDAHLRGTASLALRDQWDQQVRNRAASGDAAGDLLNFTIPISIPRTLERIIGRGEATNIRISGTEQIRIGGQTTRRSDFVSTETQQSQSLFPQLELEQQLRVDLVGQVGEKIKVRVSHNSQAIGSESTEIKLSFEGDEDDIVQTIRAGDIDVTLPGSALLGVGASRGGLFGLKVEGAVGPVSYTVLTSKEEASQETRSFSQAGGSQTEETVVIRDIDYARGRFFRLTVPGPLFVRRNEDGTGGLYDLSNVPFVDGDPNSRLGAAAEGPRIDPNSVEVYTLAPPGPSSENTVDHGIAVLDETGLGWEGFDIGADLTSAPRLAAIALDPAFGRAGEITPIPRALDDEQLATLLADELVAEGKAQVGSRWRRLSRGSSQDLGFSTAEWYPLTDFKTGLFVGIEMARAYREDEVLAVTYDIVTGPVGNEVLLRRVGRSTTRSNSTIPNVDNDGDGLGDLIGEQVTGENAVTDVQFFKLLKPRNQNDPINEQGVEDALALTWEYEYRNFYDLRGRNIDENSFRLQIERNNTSLEFADLESTTNTPWIQVFGLDQLNASNQPTPDNRVDLGENGLFDLQRGILQFPDAQPFDLPDSQVEEYTRGVLDGLPDDLRAPELYTTLINTQQEQIASNRFNLVVQQSGVSSTLDLNAFNIREGSEEIILNGRTLRSDEYDIDYFSGEVNLKGDALAELNAQSNIQVRYEQNPLFGGGRTSLSGFNLASELFDRTQISTTWLYQSRPNSQTKVRLGEEPKRNLVGNINTKSRIEPEWLRGVADFISRQPVDRSPTFDVTAEVAISVPNPNTKDIAYLEDFEQVDQSIPITLGRDGWWWASLPVRGPDLRVDPGLFPLGEIDDYTPREAFEPADRAYSGWHAPASGGRLEQGHVNPDLTEQEQRNTLPTLELIFRADASTETDFDERGGWQENEYAGVMRSLGEVDLSQAQFLEFWIDAVDEPFIEGLNEVGFPSDSTAVNAPRSGTLHFDFGDINEDFFWPRIGPEEDDFLIGTENREDRDNDGILGGASQGRSEDTGLDGLLNDEESPDLIPIAGRPGRGSFDPAGDDYDVGDDDQGRVDRGEFMYINGTEGNESLDSEDIDRDGTFDLEDGFFRVSLDLDDANPLVDIYRDFGGSDYASFRADARANRRTWRRYRLDLRSALTYIRRQGVVLPGGSVSDLDEPSTYFGREPDLSRVRTIRIWYEPDGPANPNEPNTRRIRLADMQFLGNRWIADGVRDRYDDVLDPVARNTQDFRLGVLNNKDNAGIYQPPIEVERRNNEEELEQSLQLLYEIDAGNNFRAFRDLPGRAGENYLNYDELNFFWRLPYGLPPGGAESETLERDVSQDVLSGFYRVGSDSLNYYEVEVPFEAVAGNAYDGGWAEMSISIAELSNVRSDGVEENLVRFEDYTGRINPTVTRGFVRDTRTGVVYPVTVRGRPDLERVTRYYVGVRAPLTPSGEKYEGEVLFNELRLRGVNRRVGLAQRYALNAQIPGVADLQLDYQTTDAEFRGLNRDLGTGINSTRWNARVSTRVQNWVPLGGIDLPITVQRSSDLDLPKYQPRSDRELTTADERDAFRSESTTERFSLQFRKPRPSENPILQYTLDRFNYTINGTRTERFSPTSETTGKSADQRYSYDLQLRKVPRLPVPGTGIELGVVPTQIQVTSSWRFNESQTVQKSIDDGQRIPQAPQITKGNTNQLQVTLNPLNDLSASMNFNSGRNQLYDVSRDPFEFLGVDFGVEETFSQTLGVQFKPSYRWLDWARPTVNFTGGYNENRRGTIGITLQPTEIQIAEEAGRIDELDPDGDGRKGTAGEVRNVGNRADLNVRSNVDVKGFLRRAKAPIGALGGLIDWLIPGGGDTPPAPGVGGGGSEPSGSQRSLGPSSFARPQTNPVNEDDPPASSNDPPEGGPEVEEPEGASPATDDSTATDEDQGPLLLRLDYAALVGQVGTPFTNFWKNLQPFSVNWQQQRTTTFNQIGSRADVLYRLGFASEPDFASMDAVPAEYDQAIDEVLFQDFVSTTENRSRTFSMNGQSKLSGKISLDASYRRSTNQREGAAGATGSSNVEWPNVNVRVQGVGDWGLWNQIGDPFQSSNLDFSYKRNESRANAPQGQPAPPRISRTIQPRWNVRLNSGLDANLGVTISNEESSSLQSQQFSNSLSVNLTLRQSFDADGRLKFLRFGREGTGSTIDMNVTATFRTSESYRINEGSDERDQVQGRQSIDLRPNFSYQFSRNLRASLELIYGRRKVVNTGAVDTTVGIFFDATLNF